MTKLDLLCVGRAAVDLYADQIGEELEGAASFSKYVGGCPANIAIGASRLGLQTGMLSAVGDEAMGRFVKATLEKEGVNTRLVSTKKEHLTGLAFLGIDPPDHFPLLFYREGCADMALCSEDYTLEDFQNTRAILITGTHCSTAKTFDVMCHLVHLSKQAGCQVILDIDYRPVLWGATGHGDGEERALGHPLVHERLKSLFPSCDLIVGTEEEFFVATQQNSIADSLSFLRQTTSALLVVKKGAQGCEVYSQDESSPIIGHPYPVEVLNVLGAGDAFLSGFLAGYFRDLPLEECCKLGNANGALVVTRHSCSQAMPYWNELNSFLDHPSNLDAIEQKHEQYTKEFAGV